MPYSEIFIRIAEQIKPNPTNLEVFLLAILPLIVLIIGITAIAHYICKKFKSKPTACVLLGGAIILLICLFTQRIMLWAILPLSIVAILIAIILFLNKNNHK